MEFYPKHRVRRWTGKEVRSFRKEYKLSQEHFSQMLGCRQQTVSEWEKGNYQPSLGYSVALEKLREELGFLWKKAADKVSGDSPPGLAIQGISDYAIDFEFSELVKEIYGRPDEIRKEQS